ncbi:lipid A biosynthesis acyltransferase [Tenacibaculum todarodis]|uniref:Lipid A biosynthesis acyltransferase n=1 Tax=Tenacibaculum todarodis TaxID=1850252 RepID=A0A1L3JGE0_9FLAO|nr:lipid A biosynthesis acyltransferase [Tenacibaculum todarodis]APG64189.1 lipid A biosynthesis acyltransferase [Tenacibaculum todarodis]
MKFLIFAIVYPIIWITSRLPMSILYLKSDVSFFILYYLIGYRKKVVTSNLKAAFPDKTEKEIKSISKKFFQHFTDLIFESIKSFSISEKEIKKRYQYTNTEIIDKLTKEGKNIALVGSHQANWEWAFGLPLFVDISCLGAYTKIQNKYFEKVIYNSRIRFGYNGCPTGLFNNQLQERFKTKQQSLYMLLSDQSPMPIKTRHWATFLNNFVPVHTGAETIAKKFNLAVVNINTTKIKRGYYTSDLQLITTSPNDFENYDLTEKYLKITEAHIAKQPEFYLWSHKRFKHKGKYDDWLKLKKKTK